METTILMPIKSNETKKIEVVIYQIFINVFIKFISKSTKTTFCQRSVFLMHCSVSLAEQNFFTVIFLLPFKH